MVLVSSSIQQDRLYIFLPVLLIFPGHSLYIPFLLDTWPYNSLDVLKRTQWRGLGKHLFLGEMPSIFSPIADSFLEGVVLFLVQLLIYI